jgi:hypothetical protein
MALAYSQDRGLSRKLDKVYRVVFGAVKVRAVSYDREPGLQVSGIDKVLTLRSGERLTIEEKIRRSCWPDVLIEAWSNLEWSKPGWVQTCGADYLSYAVAPLQIVYLFPVLALKAAWTKRGGEWATAYGFRDCENARYTTRSVPVPYNVVIPAIRAELRKSKDRGPSVLGAYLL